MRRGLSEGEKQGGAPSFTEHLRKIQTKALSRTRPNAAPPPPPCQVGSIPHSITSYKTTSSTLAKLATTSP
jgi:hypothetical protein